MCKEHTLKATAKINQNDHVSLFHKMTEINLMI